MAVPLVVYLAVTAYLYRDAFPRRLAGVLGIAALLILAAVVAATWIGMPLAIFAMGLLLAGLVAINVAAMERGEVRVEGLGAG